MRPSYFERFVTEINRRIAMKRGQEYAGGQETFAASVCWRLLHAASTVECLARKWTAGDIQVCSDKTPDGGPQNRMRFRLSRPGPPVDSACWMCLQ